MGKSTGISWTDHTANFWMGCQRVSPGCEHCYAETLVTGRMGLPVWGPPKTTERQRAKGVWKDVPRWNRAAASEGVRRRLFVSSLADIFEDHPQVAPWRAEALTLLERCTALDVQLLTKRPENIRAMVPEHWLKTWPAHVWIGTTVEDQKRADERIPHLLSVPAQVRFLSCEPLLSSVDLKGWGEASPTSPDDSVSNSWSSFVWPDWIPDSLRKLIANFWTEKCGRGPRSWLQDHVVQHVPRTGAEVTLRERGNGWLDTNKMVSEGVRGRYVHMWNNIGRVVGSDGSIHPAAGGIGSGWLSRWMGDQGRYIPGISWVIVGGESGPDARPFAIEWARSIVRQCRDAGVAVFVKQMGDNAHDDVHGPLPESHAPLVRTGRHIAFKARHGADPSEWPADLRVQEFPGGSP